MINSITHLVSGHNFFSNVKNWLGIRVNSVCPGTIDSPLLRKLVKDEGSSMDFLNKVYPMKRIGKVREVRTVFLFIPFVFRINMCLQY